MSAEVQLSGLVPLLNVDQSEKVVTEILQCVETQILGQKMLNCIESQIVGHELGPVVAFSDLLELGADCTVLGDDYINEHDVFDPSVVIHHDNGVLLPHQHYEDNNSNTATEFNSSNNDFNNSNNNNNNAWFADVDNTDFNSILSTVDPFNFSENILFEDDSAALTNFVSSSDVIVSRDPSTNLFQCPHCSKTFQYCSRLQRHLTVHQSKQYKCKTCDKYFSRLDVMETHVARSHGGSSSSLHSSSSSSPSISSSEVDDWSPIKRSVKMSNMSGNGSPCFACSECPAILASHHHLQRHVTSHKNKIGNFVCQHCQKSFSVKHKYQMHLRQHLTDRKFKCYLCGLGFLQAEFLSRHLLTHSQENPFKCNDCGTSFNQLINLKQHQLRKHRKNKDEPLRRHLCSKCDKMFLTSSELKNHMIYHSNVRRFPCTACDSAFLEKRHLDRHMRRIHSGIKNFFCSVCGKAFFEKFELNYHLRMSSCNMAEK